MKGMGWDGTRWNEKKIEGKEKEEKADSIKKLLSNWTVQTTFQLVVEQLEFSYIIHEKAK